MAIDVTCLSCGKTMQLPDRYAGKKGKCPACGAILQVPAAAAIPELEPIYPGVPLEADPAPPPQLPRPSLAVLSRHHPRGSSWFKDVILFRRMITPIVVQVLFWLAIGFCLLLGLSMIAEDLSSSHGDDTWSPRARPASKPNAFSEFLISVDVALYKIRWYMLYFIVAPLLIRVTAEEVIVLFQIHGSLQRIERSVASIDRKP